MYDLVLRRGTVVTSGSLGKADIGINLGHVVQLGGDMRGRREISVDGLHVLPGGVDVHVHLTSPQEPEPGDEVWIDDFESGTAAALAGGVTTIGNMTFQRRGESLRGALVRDLAIAKESAMVDYILHPVVMDPRADVIEEIPALAAEGHTSIKVFMPISDFDCRLDDFSRAIVSAAQAGCLTMIHCEDAHVISWASEALLGAGRAAVSNFPDSRPVHAEEVATQRAVALCRTTRAPMYVVHLSSVAALEVCRRARADGLPIYVETRPLYLHLTRERFLEADAGKYVGAPPLRQPEDRAALWNALRAGDVQTCCSDHAPWSLAQKLDPTLTVATARQGVADLETMLPMLMSEGVRAGQITLSRFVELTSTNAAKIFGLYPRKGTIAVGSDADVVVWDLTERRVVDGANMNSRAGYSVYDGWAVTGWPVLVISRGDVVFEGRTVTAKRGRGQWVQRERTTPL